MFKFFGGSKDPGAAVMAAADVASSALPPPPAADSGSQRGSRSSLAAELSCRLDVDSQMSGHLFKRDTSGASNNWNLRFFVIKDGFLLWYPEQKEDRSGGRGTGGGGGGSIMTFDMHPKGVVPLDGVDIETVRAGPNAGMTSALRVTHPSFGTRSLLLCAGDDSERDRWVAALTASSYITYGRAIAAAAELESLKRTLREATVKSSQLESQLAKKTEQVIKLVAQNRGLLGAVQQAEQAHGIKIDLLASPAAAASTSAASTSSAASNANVHAASPSSGGSSRTLDGDVDVPAVSISTAASPRHLPSPDELPPPPPGGILPPPPPPPPRP